MSKYTYFSKQPDKIPVASVVALHFLVVNAISLLNEEGVIATRQGNEFPASATGLLATYCEVSRSSLRPKEPVAKTPRFITANMLEVPLKMLNLVLTDAAIFNSFRSVTDMRGLAISFQDPLFVSAEFTVSGGGGKSYSMSVAQSAKELRIEIFHRDYGRPYHTTALTHPDPVFLGVTFSKEENRIKPTLHRNTNMALSNEMAELAIMVVRLFKLPIFLDAMGMDLGADPDFFMAEQIIRSHCA